MLVSITRTTPIYASPETAGIFVQWSVSEPPVGQDITFELLRSGGAAGPFTTIAAGLTGTHFFDQHVESLTPDEQSFEQTSLQRNAYYTVVANGTARSSTVPIGDALPRRQMLLRRKIQRDISVAFRVGSGIPWAVLTRKRWGKRCTNAACYDKLTKSVMDSKCLTCFGTSFDHGYYDPFVIMARKGVTNVTVSVAGQGKVEVNQLEMTMLDYPRMEVDDVLVELRQDRRYVIKHVSRTELRGVPVHQKLVLSELARDSVEYRIPVGSGQTPTFF